MHGFSQPNIRNAMGAGIMFMILISFLHTKRGLKEWVNQLLFINKLVKDNINFRFTQLPELLLALSAIATSWNPALKANFWDICSKTDSLSLPLANPYIQLFANRQHMAKQRVPGLPIDLMKKGKHFILIRNPLDILVNNP